MKVLSYDFIKKVAHSLQEEEIDVYVLNLYFRGSEDLNYFAEKDQERLKQIFNILIEDTKHHAELLKLIVELGSQP